MNLIEINNKSGKISLKDIVMQPVMDELITEMSRIFGAKAAENGAYTGELTNYAENAVDTLEIVIHSPGGSVLDGYTLYHEIQGLRARGVVVTATINSLAASMASVIAMACDNIRMVPQGRMMIHEVQQGIRGGADELAAAAKLCDSMSNEIAEIYAGKTCQTVSEMREMMKKETWMNAKEALAAGFIDEVFDIRSKEPTKNDMSILAKLFPGNDQVAQLEAQVAENDSLRIELTEAQAKITELSGHAEAIATAQAEIVALTEANAAKLAELESNAAKITELEAAIIVTDEKVSAAAAELLAASGHPAPLEISGGIVTAQKEMTRESFNALNPQAKMDFVKAGGKLI